MAPLIVVAVIVLLPLVVVIGVYNNLVKLRNHCDEAWSGVDTELQRRYNLIPNLVNTVKGYAKHEKELLEAVARLREECIRSTGSPGSQAEPENRLIRALGTLMARLEDYPDLKASGNFLELQRELVNTEDRLQAARRFYNGNVRENNNAVQSIPSNMIASMFGFGTREYFEIDDVRAVATPKVEI